MAITVLAHAKAPRCQTDYDYESYLAVYLKVGPFDRAEDRISLNTQRNMCFPRLAEK